METKPSCEAAILPIQSWDFAAFRGLSGCTRTTLPAALGTSPLPGEGRSRLGDPPKTTTFLVFPLEDAPRGAKVWVEGEQVLSVLVELPPVSDVPALLAALGPPDASGDWQWDVVTVAGGERIWAGRGLTLMLDRAGSKIVRAYFYTPTSAGEWRSHLRPSDTVREER